MQVQVDNIWSSRAVLHMRVTVWADDRSWRRRHDVAVPFEDLCDEALDGLIAAFAPEPAPADVAQLRLW